MVRVSSRQFAAFLVALTACAASPPSAPPARPTPAVPPPPPHAEGHVEIAVLGAGSDGAWGFFDVEPGAPDRVRACYRAALAIDPTSRGHAVFAAERLYAQTTTVKLVRASEISRDLDECILHALETLQSSPVFALEPNLPPSHVYVSLW